MQPKKWKRLRRSYTRWSSDGQGDGGSDRRQKQMAERWCVERGLSLTGLEKDEGVSGWKGRNQREGSGLPRLLKIIKPGDFLLVEDNDRLSRQDWFAHMTFLGNIVSRGVTVVTLTNGNEMTRSDSKAIPRVSCRPFYAPTWAMMRTKKSPSASRHHGKREKDAV